MNGAQIIPISQTVEPLAVVQPTIELILSQAVQAGRTGAELKELLDVFERLNAKKAEQAFSAAFADFRAACPSIPRRSENTQFKVTRNGVIRPMMYASLEDIAAVVDPLLPKFGLSGHFTDPPAIEGRLGAIYVLSHVGGHSRSSSSPMFPVGKPIVSREGRQVTTEIQAYVATYTTARRIAITGGLGLATRDEDTDGNEPDGPTITEDQIAHLTAILDETQVDIPKFLKYANVQALPDIKKSCFDGLVAAIESKRKAAV